MSRIFYSLEDKSCLLFPASLFNLLDRIFGVLHYASPIVISQVKNLRHKAQLQEVEQERTTKQLKEVMAIAEVETAKCKASHQDTTAQVRWIYVCLWSIDIYFNKMFALYLCMAMCMSNHCLNNNFLSTLVVFAILSHFPQFLHSGYLYSWLKLFSLIQLTNWGCDKIRRMLKFNYTPLLVDSFSFFSG